MKRILTILLNPLIRFYLLVREPLTRIWAYAALSQLLGRGIDPSVVVLGLPEVRGTARIGLGRNLFLYRELYLETQADGEIAIGDDVVISRGTHIVAFNRITIGAGTMIGEYCSLRDANHRFGNGQSIRSSGHVSAPIVIGRNVWIGRGVTVLPGVTIGDHAVIGANSVVTGDIPSGAIAVGAPARMMPMREAA